MVPIAALSWSWPVVTQAPLGNMPVGGRNRTFDHAGAKIGCNLLIL